VDLNVPVRPPSRRSLGSDRLARELRRLGVQALLGVRYVQGGLMAKALPRITCTHHCRVCGRHFHSLAAFDLHLEHDTAGWPHCLDPLDLQDRDTKARLEVVTDDAACRVVEGEQDPVTVWAVAGSAEKARKAFGTAPVGSREAP
jgi:hypothetical protein